MLPYDGTLGFGLARISDSMDLAKNVAQWRDQAPEQWMAQVNRFLPPVAVAVLVFLIALKAADLTWRLLDAPADQAIVPPTVAVTVSASNPVVGSYEALAAWEPFGGTPDDGAEPISADLLLDAPDTTLNLRLLSTWQAQELPERGSIVIPERGLAVISSGRGEQTVYWTSDDIEDANGTTLHSVFSDRVLLNRGGGRLETLRYPEVENVPLANSRLTARAPQRTAAQRETPIAAASLAAVVGEAAAVLSEHMQFSMHTDSGQVVGFRVQPLGDSQVFSQLGLQPGDVLTEVNGMRLGDLRNRTQVIQALTEARQANVTIRRNGTDHATVIDIGQIQRLAQSLQ